MNTKRRPEAEGHRTGVAKNIRDFVKLEKEKRELNDKLKLVKAQIDEKVQGVKDHFTQMGYDKITLDGITLYLKRSIRASKIADTDDDAFKEAMIANDLGHLVKATANANSLASHFRKYEESLEVQPNHVDQLVPESLKEFISIHEIFDIGTRKG